MNYRTEYLGITFDIEYEVDSEGDYSQFDIEIGGNNVNDVLDSKVVKKLEEFTWDLDYIPGCKEHNDDLKINNYLSSIGE